MRWAEDKKSEAKGMRPAEAPADKALVLICEKCGDHSFAKGLKSELKSRGKDKLGKGAVRVMFTSCMSICPKDGIAVALARTDGKNATEFFVVSEDAGKAAGGILEKLS